MKTIDHKDGPGKINENIRNLFPLDFPNVAIIEGILEGKIHGNIFLNPKKDACVVTTNTSFNFIAGNVSDGFFKKSLSLIDKKNSSFLVNCSNLNFFIEKELPTNLRLHFSGDANNIKDLPDKLNEKILSKYSLKEIDSDLFENCQWKNHLIEFYNDKELFLNFGYGSILLDKEQIIAEVYGTIGGSFLELGAFVNPTYRSAGLCPFIITHSIKKYCLSKKLTITASCNASNIASKKTIMRLGLKENFQYPVLDISKINVYQIDAVLQNVTLV